MREITYEELKSTRKYVECKAIELMRSAEKNHAVVGVPYQNYRLYQVGDRLFYSVQTNTFKVIIDDFLIRAQTLMPEKFGTGEAKHVIDALYQINPIFDLDSFTEYLQKEKCTYVFESENGKVIDRILRLDLFRLLQKGKKDKFEFTGGLFHALKHFSKNGVNYSIGKGKLELNHPHELIQSIIEAFFVDKGKFENDKEYVVDKELDEIYNVKYVFHRQPETGVFFLNTVYKEPK